jgi:hypothetical protein
MGIIETIQSALQPTIRLGWYLTHTPNGIGLLALYVLLFALAMVVEAFVDEVRGVTAS